MKGKRQEQNLTLLYEVPLYGEGAFTIDYFLAAIKLGEFHDIELNLQFFFVKKVVVIHRCIVQ